MAKARIVRVSREDLIKSVAVVHGLTKKQAHAIVASIFTDIAASVQWGGEVTIRGFGRFLERKGGGFTRQGHDIPKRKRLAFIPSVNQKVEVE